MIDLSNLLAAPMATMLLADFGAEVIKVEDPTRGDELRRWGYLKDGRGLFFKMVNRNKKLITCNLRLPEGQDLVRQLASVSDVVVEAFRPGRAAAWGLDYDSLRQIRPSLVMLSVSGYGQTGPASTQAGFGTVLEAESGYAYITGEVDGPPLLPNAPLGDSVTGVYGAFAVMLALFNRETHGGRGQHIDLAIYEGLMNLLGPQFVNFDQLGVVQERSGSRLEFVAPRNTYRTKDDHWIAIAGATQSTFERVASSLGREQLLEDPRFATNQARIANAAALDEILQEALLDYTRDEALRLLGEAGAAVGRINSVRDVFENPHFSARGNIATVDDPDFGPMRMQGVIPRLSDTPGRIDHTAHELGAANEEVYGELLGLSSDALAKLKRDGII